jgi:gamma-glutamylcyclotransferase (GGCT)/AIG2-like uncharacterized protein YtfP
MTAEAYNPDKPQTPLILFVYGTLKRGYWNHGMYCRDMASARTARVRGRLWEFPASGIPIMQAEREGDFLALGTADPLADAATQTRIAEEGIAAPDSANNADGWVLGELLTFNDPAKSLPDLDRLEGFDPAGDASRYRRVLLPVQADDDGAWLPAWVYIGQDFKRLEPIGSEWPVRQSA